MGWWQQAKRFFIADLTTTQDPFSLGHWETPKQDDPSARSQALSELPRAFAGQAKGENLTADLETNLQRLKDQFHLPDNQSLLVHHITLTAEPPRPAAVVYVTGMVDPDHLARSVIAPLIGENRQSPAPADPAELLREAIPEGQTAKRRQLADIINDMLDGSVAVLVSGQSMAVTVRIEGWPKRSINRPQAEITVRGPQESFTEDLRTNITQVRRRLRSPDVVVEFGRVGRLSRTDVAVVYVTGLTNPDLVGEVRRRIAAVDVDYVADAASLGQFIEDHPHSLYPTSLSTERPDRVAVSVSEGFVAILIDNDSHALVVPTTITTLMHSGEDVYARWSAGTFMRMTRVGSYYVSLLLPAAYIALANYRQEMIPTPLLLAIAHSRETVPFTAVVEVLLMEASFELIHEAAVRVPMVIGPTIGIVGSLILGQAAVQAGVVSPILVIITSATALASFAIPNYELQMATRMWRFSYIAAASVFGLMGIVLLHTAYVAYLCSINSFGAPYLAPLAPFGRKGDVLIRAPIYKLDKRPDFVRPQRTRQQAHITRPWWPKTPSRPRKEEPDDQT